jgi:precorrin-6x reductase
VLFPDVIQGIAFSIIVSEKEITVTENHISPEYNSDLLEQNLIDFLIFKAS